VSAPTPEQRAAWRREAGRNGDAPVAERILDNRILALLDALDSDAAAYWHDRWAESEDTVSKLRRELLLTKRSLEATKQLLDQASAANVSLSLKINKVRSVVAEARRSGDESLSRTFDGEPFYYLSLEDVEGALNG
jgi:hypothetical protein